ncbi:Serine/threonine-protein kinase [Cladorrhinum sp. PSN332]|nr:Serine/threonine-protein kinase [Cladorrhinum sp. PSN332]
MFFAGILNSSRNRLKSVFARSSKQLQPVRAISEESIGRYCEGGYHPVRIGDVFNGGKYKVVSKLGYGVYSTVWLACTLHTKRHVALKILTADSYGTRQDTFELDILERFKAQTTPHPGSSRILGLLDKFEHHGPNGRHLCLVFKAMGPDMSRYSHIKPQNILLETSAINTMFDQAPSEVFLPQKLPSEHDFYIESTQVSSAEEDLMRPKELSVRLADFGTASWFDQHLTEWIQPQMLRAPEVILGAEWDFKVDIWNLGLVLWELGEGQILFDGCLTPEAPYTAEAHFAQMTALLGDMPKSLLTRATNKGRYFDSEGTLLQPSAFPPCSLEQFSKVPDLSDAEKAEYLDFIRSMIALDPAQRPDAKTLLDSKWLR